MRARKINCPLCSVPTSLSALTKQGTCQTCSDARRDAQRESHKEAQAATIKAVEADLEALRRYNVVAKTIIKAKQDRIKGKEKAQKKKELSDVQKEQASLALARRSLLHYAERYSPGYDASWFHEDVARRIERFVQDVADKKSPRLMLACPSRSGKSLLASECAPAWILGQHPDWNIVIASYSDDLPTKFSRAIREQLRSPEYRSIFPNGARLNPEDSSAKAWTTTAHGGMRATGVGGGLLGFGADVLILDDLIKDAEMADSPTALEKVYDWASSVAYSRLLPGGGIIVINQRFAVEDLTGRLETRMYEEEKRIQELYTEADNIENFGVVTEEKMREASFLREEARELDSSMDKWDIISYPALSAADEYLTESGEIIRMPPGSTPKQDWRLLRKQGEALHPKRYTRSYYLKLKRANPRLFAAMYQLSPIVDEGAYFRSSSFKRYSAGKHPKLELCYKFCAWDLALGQKQTNDYTVGIAGAYDYEGNLWLLERIRGRFGDIRDIATMIMDLHIKYDCVQTGIERTHMEMAMAPILHSMMSERNEYINLAEGKEALKPITDKKVRARTLQNLCNAGKVYVPEGEDWDEFIGILSRFGSSSIDDDVDSASWLAILCTRQPPPTDPKTKHQRPKKEESWLDELLEEIRGQGAGYMEA